MFNLRFCQEIIGFFSLLPFSRLRRLLSRSRTRTVPKWPGALCRHHTLTDKATASRNGNFAPWVEIIVLLLLFMAKFNRFTESSPRFPKYFYFEIIFIGFLSTFDSVCSDLHFNSLNIRTFLSNWCFRLIFLQF